MKSKKFISRMAIFTTLCILAVVVGANRAEASSFGQTPVIYDVEESAAFPLSVTAEGNGSVQYNETSIRESTAEFLLKVDESMTFTLSPNEGETVEKITLNGEDIADSLQGNTLSVHGAEKHQELKVTFSAVHSGEGTAPDSGEGTMPDSGEGTTSNSGTGNHTPSTGDHMQSSLYITLGLGSFLGIFILAGMKRKNKKRDEGRVI